MIEIKSQNDLEQYRREGAYHFHDNVLFRCSVVAHGSIEADMGIAASENVETSGSIVTTEGSITAGGFIRADRHIKAGGFIRANRHIKAGGFIETSEYVAAGGDIIANKYIVTGEYIKADESIKTGWIEADWIFSFDNNVSAETISTDHLPAWRKFWAEMPPLRRWREQILDESICWNDFKAIPENEAREICAWEGWHWILRGQLECFFGFKHSFQPPK